MQKALDLVEDSGTRVRPHPASYASLGSYGLSCLKEHRYWFGFIVVDGEAVITNVLYDAADIPNRLNRPD